MREGWEKKTLGELCTVITKGTTPTSVGHSFIDEGINFVKIESISLDGKFLPHKFAHISEEAHIALKRSQLQEGDILFSIAGALGRTALVTNEILPANTNQALSIIRLKDESIISKEYLLSALSTGFTLEQVEKFKGGVAQLNLSLTQMKSFEIPISSLKEQKQIVTTLDKAFKQIDQVKANLEKNLNNAKELFQSKLNEVFSQRGEGWEEKSFNEICKITSKLIDPKEEEYQDLLHIGAGNIESEKGILNNLKTAKEENLISGKFLFDAEMVLYSKIRPYLMKVVKCDFVGLCSADIYPLVPEKKEITQSFLYYLLLSNNFTEYAIKGSARAGMPKVNRKHLFDYRCYLPNIEKQDELSKILDIIFEESLKLQTHYQQKLNNLEELKKSILQKAFKGELDYA